MLPFKYRALQKAGSVDDIPSGVLKRALRSELEKSDPDVVAISGYSEPAFRESARWLRARGQTAVLMSESTEADRFRLWPVEWAKGWFIRKYFSAAFVGGERSAAYLSKLGFPVARIWKGYDVVDNDLFARKARRVRARPRAHRQRLRLPEKYFLYVGRFAPEKNLPLLLRAYGRYRRETTTKPWDLVLVGSGPLEKALHAQSAALGLGGVHWPGFLQLSDLPSMYALASCFILPSRSEPWGLVVNEAMACGLPVLVSERAGAAGDLVVPGMNGYLFDPDDEDALQRLMRRIAGEATRLNKMGASSHRIIAAWSCQRWAEQLSDAIDVIVADRAHDKSRHR